MRDPHGHMIGSILRFSSQAGGDAIYVYGQHGTNVTRIAEDRYASGVAARRLANCLSNAQLLASDCVHHRHIKPPKRLIWRRATPSWSPMGSGLQSQSDEQPRNLSNYIEMRWHETINISNTALRIQYPPGHRSHWRWTFFPLSSNLPWHQLYLCYLHRPSHH